MVRFSDAGLRYPDPSGGEGDETLKHLSFTLPRGSFTWLTGASGAGKTTLLRLMQCALRPTSGEVEILGVRLSQAKREALPPLRRRIGAVFQDYRLLPYLSAFDNVALPLRLAGRSEASLRPDVAELLRWVGLENRADSLPPQLSGGEQQRVAIARAVVARPELLVADEPTGNLDPRQARRLLALLTEMNRLGTTVVVATHSEELVAAFPAPVMTLERGRLVAFGHPDEAPDADPAASAWNNAPEQGPTGTWDDGPEPTGTAWDNRPSPATTTWDDAPDPAAVAWDDAPGTSPGPASRGGAAASPHGTPDRRPPGAPPDTPPYGMRGRRDG
ncbi:cell division ATP-binding protein FtsE [Roseomonas sp. BN140053]|uniref:cell division ATP-binding protein FtsE n=1 Tax=Roseomonas sp. BN140053 TaxID=3391898 RepID=UPI0039E7D7BF